MCGIYGIFQRTGSRFAMADIERMGAAQAHRGPDDRGTFHDGPLMFGMQRLAIIDVEGGHQPITNEDGSVVAICNGEIYNFRELRADLQQRGHRFSTGSDSEVVVHLYEEYGDDFVAHLSGMFGLALWDRRHQRLLIARDRLGIKPLYVLSDSAYVAFSSELKSILELPNIDRTINQEALAEYLSLGYVPAPLTMFKGIDKLEPGRVMIVDQDGCRQQTYWSIPQGEVVVQSNSDWSTEIASTLESAIASQMVSDVPLGAFLSGGIDSSAVVAFMSKHSNRPVKTYSIGFDTGGGSGYYNELPYARQVAELFGTDHREIVVKPDVAGLLPELIWHLDEPIADAAFITTYLVSKFARQDVTVILSGVGGDELFGGYRRYWGDALVRNYKRIPAFVRRAVIQPLARRLPSDRHSRLLDWSRLAKGFLLSAELPTDERYEEFVRVFGRDDLDRMLKLEGTGRSSALQAAFARASEDDVLRRLTDVDLMTQLPDDLLMLTDRMSMATSLECRVPLLDDTVVDLACRMPSDIKVRGTQLKVALKDSLRGILPDAIIDRQKRGFGAPIGSWIKHELAGFMESVLSEERVRERGLFDWQAISELRSAHESNRQDYTDHLLAAMNFELWCQIYLDGEAHESVSTRLMQAAAA